MLNANEVRIAPHGRILTAAVGVTAPADVESDFDAGWFELGYVDDEGVVIAPNLETEDHRMWQSLPPVKTSATGLMLEISFNMGQINTGTTSLFFFGAEWAEVSPGVYRLDVESNTLLEERALAVEWTDDGGDKNRLIVPRGFVADRENMQLQRSSVTTLGITYRALDNSGEFFYLISENPSLAPEGS